MQKQVVELAGVPVGIAIPEGNAMKFLAVKFHAMDLDGQHFRSLSDIKRALYRLLEEGHKTAA